MCLYTRLIKNPKYKPNTKNGGKIPEVKDRRTTVAPVSCGKCMECRKKKANSWRIRLIEDIKDNKNGKFVTLTFDEESLTKLKRKFDTKKGYDLENSAAVLGVRRFLERWRKKYKKSVRHWLVTELGQKNTERIHIHGIIWTDEIEDISKIWKYGHINIGEQKWKDGIKIAGGLSYVNARSINYIVKYLHKADPLHKEYIPKTMCSPKIGYNYINSERAKDNKYKPNGNTKDYYVTPKGVKLGLPEYYRQHIYTDEERELLWIESLNKNVRYVNGIKFDVKLDNTAYFKQLEHERKKNEKLGFGNNIKDWEKKKLEEEQRWLRQHTHSVVKFGTNKKKLNGRNSAEKSRIAPAIDKKQARVKVSLPKMSPKDLWEP